MADAGLRHVNGKNVEKNPSIRSFSVDRREQFTEDEPDLPAESPALLVR